MKLMNKTTSQNQQGVGHVVVIIGLVVIMAVGLVGWRIESHHKVKQTALVVTSPTPRSTTDSSAPAAGSSDYASDLNGINSSMSQESTDSSSANSAVNDQQSEVTVPAN
jgi:hypothetical protein